MTKEEKYTTLDTEQCKWWVNTLFGMAKEQACNSHNFEDGEEMQAAQDKIIKALEQQPCDDCVSRKAVAEIINKQRFGIHQISMGIIKEKIESEMQYPGTIKITVVRETRAEEIAK